MAYIPFVFSIALGAILFAARAIQTRGRFRVATIPAMVTGMVLGLYKMALVPVIWSDVLIGVVCIFCASIILLVAQSHEIA